MCVCVCVCVCVCLRSPGLDSCWPRILGISRNTAIYRGGMPLSKGQEQSSLDPNEMPPIVMSGQGLHYSLI